MANVRCAGAGTESATPATRAARVKRPKLKAKRFVLFSPMLPYLALPTAGSKAFYLAENRHQVSAVSLEGQTATTGRGLFPGGLRRSVGESPTKGNGPACEGQPV